MHEVYVPIIAVAIWDLGRPIFSFLRSRDSAQLNLYAPSGQLCVCTTLRIYTSADNGASVTWPECTLWMNSRSSVRRVPTSSTAKLRKLNSTQLLRPFSFFFQTDVLEVLVSKEPTAKRSRVVAIVNAHPPMYNCKSIKIIWQAFTRARDPSHRHMQRRLAAVASA